MTDQPSAQPHESVREPVRAVRRPDGLPSWFDPMLAGAAAVRVEDLTRLRTPTSGGRESAVLVLFGEGEDGPDVLLIERAHDMSNHAGQPAFPGGAADPGDADPVATAVREAVEETGLHADGVEPLVELPGLWVPSGFVVRPVIAWWRVPSDVYVVDPIEVAAVHRVPVAELTDPARRLRVRHPSGYVGPAFDVRGMRVWGFTGGLLSTLLRLAGWERPWDTRRLEPLEPPPGADDRPPFVDDGGPDDGIEAGPDDAGPDGPRSAG
jgi:8-oxo-dGTP pyrophosphatase MutT (NUDIX family)